MSGGEIHYLDPGLMETMCHRFAREMFDLMDDPISPFGQHDHALLESALDLPRTAFQGKDMYPTLPAKAAVLWYSLNRNHAFQNGNKRISTASVLVFLYMNDHWLNAAETELVDRSLRIAQSPPAEREGVLRDMEEWIAEHLITWSQGKKSTA